MNLFDSPFYILGAAPQDNRRKIAALADEKVFLSDGERISEARSVLTTPSKRLSAEIRWFPALNAEELSEAAAYCAALQHGAHTEEPELADKSTLAALNIKLYAFPMKAFADYFQIKYSLLEISRLFASLDAEVLRGEINRDRTVSGFPEIQSIAEIEDALTCYRDEIRKDISLRLMTLPQQDYAKLVTLLAEKYATPEDRYNGHAVLEDILAEYELRMTPEIERQKQQIIEMASFIEKGAKEIRVADAVHDLVAMVTEWDVLARPLQLEARGRGQKHGASENVAHEIRELAVALHNKHGMTEEAIRLTEALKEFFSELADFSERISEDFRTLHRLKQEKEAEAQEEQASINRNRMDKKYAVTLHADSIVVPPFCTCCMRQTSTWETVSASTTQLSGNRKTTRTISMKMPICPQCLEHRRKAAKTRRLIVMLSVAFAAGSVPAASMGLSTSKSLFWAIPFVVALTAYLLLGLTIKLPLLGKEHSTRQQSAWLGGIELTGNTTTFIFTNWRYAKLFAAANQAQKLCENANSTPQSMLEIDYRNRAKSHLYLKAADHPVGVGFLVLGLTAAVMIVFGGALASLGGSSAPAASTQKPSDTYTSPSTPSATTKPQTSFAPSSIPARQQKLNTLETKLNARKKEIEDMEDELTALSDDIDAYESKYYETNNGTYADQYYDAVDEYNALWEEYDKAVDDYNEMINEYNSLLY